MNIKIVPKTATPKPDDVHTDSAAAVGELAVNEPALEPVAQIAQELLTGKIDSSQAIDKLIEHTIDSDMVKNAPPELRLEVEQALKTAIETDPYLSSLAKGIE